MSNYRLKFVLTEDDIKDCWDVTQLKSFVTLLERDEQKKLRDLKIIRNLKSHAMDQIERAEYDNQKHWLDNKIDSNKTDTKSKCWKNKINVSEISSFDKQWKEVQGEGAIDLSVSFANSQTES